MITDMQPLIDAAMAKKIVSLNYTKTNGEVVDHRVGIYEIGENKSGNPTLWGWDVDKNDNIRQFLLSNINQFQVFEDAFFPPQPWPIKINGQIVG